MLPLSAEAGRQPGDTIPLPAGGGAVRLTVQAFSGQPLRSLEVVVNGKVAGRAELRPQARVAELKLPLDLRAGSWIAARATAEDRLLSDAEMERFRQAGKNLGGEAPCRLRFAHTSPIYVTVGGAGAQGA